MVWFTTISEWICPISEELASFVIEEEMVKHPELVPQKERLLEKKSNEIGGMIQEGYQELQSDFEHLDVTLQEWLQTLPPVKNEVVLSDFKKASSAILNDEVIGNLDYLLKNPHENEPTYQLQFQISDTTLELLYSWGRELHELKNTRTARALFRFLTLLNPNHPDFWIGLGLAYLVENQIPLAEINFEMASSLDPNHSQALYFLANCAALNHKNEEALTLCREAEKCANPKNKQLLSCIHELMEILKR